MDKFWCIIVILIWSYSGGSAFHNLIDSREIENTMLRTLFFGVWFLFTIISIRIICTNIDILSNITGV